MTEIVAKHLRIPEERVLVASTGVIGRYLPMDKIRPALPKLVKGLSPQGSRAAAEGIMTTDTHPKEAALRVEIGGRRVTIGGIAKGTGMIHPHDGDDVLLRRHRPGAWSATRSRPRCGAAVDRLVQPDQRRRRPQHQRHGARPGQRARREPAARAGRPAAASLPAGARRADPAAGGHAGEGRRGRDPGDRRARARGQDPAGRGDGGPRDRELHPLQDGHGRPRSELGPRHVGPGRPSGIAAAGGPGRGLVRRGAGGGRRPAPGGRPLGPRQGRAGQARGDRHGGPRPRHRPGPRVDLRPDDRLR